MTNETFWDDVELEYDRLHPDDETDITTAIVVCLLLAVFVAIKLWERRVLSRV